MKTNVQLFLMAIAVSQTSLALEVDREVMPRIAIGGRAIATLDAVNKDSNPSASDETNIEDTALLLRFDKRIYSQKGVAGAVIGFNEHENSVRFQQANAFFWNQDVSTHLGRMRLPNTIIEFPTLRDDDLLTYTHVGNGSSNEEFDQLYGSGLLVDWFVDKKIQAVRFWLGSRTNQSGVANAPTGFDSIGLGYVYEQPEDLALVKRIRHAGLFIDRQKVNATGLDEWLTSVVGGVQLNLNDDPSKPWVFGIQGNFNSGVSGITLADIQNSNTGVLSQSRAKSRSLVSSISYTARPNLLTRWQAAVTVAYKDYSDLSDASQWSIAPSFVYRLGQGIDLLAQIKHTAYSNGLYNGGADTVAQLGIAFSFESVFNDQIGERDSILNLEHGYLQ